MDAILENPLQADPERFTLGETSDEVYLSSLEQNCLAVQRLLEQAKFRFYILNRNMDSDLFGTAEFCEAVSRLCRRGGRHTDVRFLVCDDRKLVHERHRLLKVIRHHDSSIQLRTLPHRYAHLEQAYVLADESGVFVHGHQEAHQYDAKVNFHAPNLLEELREDFMHLWEYAEADPYVRQFGV